MGQAEGGFPQSVSEKILRGEKPLQGRPGASLPDADFKEASDEIRPLLDRDPLDREVVSHLLYPQVFQDFAQHQQKFTDTSALPTPAFFYGLQPNEEIAVDIADGNGVVLEATEVATPLSSHADVTSQHALIGAEDSSRQDHWRRHRG